MAEQNKMTRQEELFCGLYALLGNPAEAAVQAGYAERNALRAAVRLLGRADIREEVARRAAEERSRTPDRALAGLLRLAMGPANPSGEEPEIKPTDRLKAFELLFDTIGQEPDARNHSLVGALEQGAAALSGLSFGQGCEGDAV